MKNAAVATLENITTRCVAMMDLEGIRGLSEWCLRCSREEIGARGVDNPRIMQDNNNVRAVS